MWYNHHPRFSSSLGIIIIKAWTHLKTKTYGKRRQRWFWANSPKVVNKTEIVGDQEIHPRIKA